VSQSCIQKFVRIASELSLRVVKLSLNCIGNIIPPYRLVVVSDFSETKKFSHFARIGYIFSSDLTLIPAHVCFKLSKCVSILYQNLKIVLTSFPLIHAFTYKISENISNETNHAISLFY